jgi:prephenate dehydrogenase
MSDLKRLDESNAYLGEAVALANSRADELERLRRELAEARWLLNHAVTRDTVAEWTQRRDAFLASDQPGVTEK